MGKSSEIRTYRVQEDNDTSHTRKTNKNTLQAGSSVSPQIHSVAKLLAIVLETAPEICTCECIGGIYRCYVPYDMYVWSVSYYHVFITKIYKYAL